MSNDPLLQPCQFKHLILRNRTMTTSNQPANPEDGLPKTRHAGHQPERAKSGVALTKDRDVAPKAGRQMTAG